MIFPTVVGDAAGETGRDVGYVRVKNASGGALAKGDAVSLETGTLDGVRVSKVAANTLTLFVGVLMKALADGEVGTAQSYGLCSAAYVTNDYSQAITIGDVLTVVSTKTHLARSAAGTAAGTGWAFAAEAVAEITTTTLAAKALKKVLLRAM